MDRKNTGGKLEGGTDAGSKTVDPKGKHSQHGADGSHQNSHKQLGGSRAKILTGDPGEQ